MGSMLWVGDLCGVVTRGSREPLNGLWGAATAEWIMCQNRIATIFASSSATHCILGLKSYSTVPLDSALLGDGVYRNGL